MGVADNIGALFAPRNVVLVGASDRNWSARVFQNLERMAFAGEIYLVNPNRPQLWGRRCYASVDDLPETADHLAVFLPADQTLDLLDAQQGKARSASLYAAGFGENDDPAGHARAARLAAIVAASRMAVVGPNCMGLSVARTRLCTVPDEQLSMSQPGPVAALTQSGMLVQTLSRGFESAGLALSHLISCGNQIGLTFADYIDALAENDDLRVIACYIESVKERDAFLAAAAKAKAAGKTVVAIKIGGSDAARAAALAHTGSLAGSNAAFDVFAGDVGVVRVDALEDLVEAAAFLARARRPKGERVALMTNSGALKSLMVEATATLDLQLAQLAPKTCARLRAALPDADPGSPYDTKRTLPTDQYMACVEALHDDPGVDAVLIAEELPRAEGIDRKIRNFRALDDWLAQGPAKPVAVFSPLTLRETDYMLETRAALPNTPWTRDLGKSLRTFARLVDHSAPPVRPAPISPARAPLIASARARAAALSRPTALSEPESKALLAAYGVRTPMERATTGVEEAVHAAREIGFPVVLKGVAPEVTHKSDAGLVALSLADEAAVRAAANDIAARCGQAGARLDGFLVAQHVSGGIEMVVGVHRDPEMGHVTMVGMGGVWLELFEDVAFGPPALDMERARRMIGRTRAARLLAGYRGAPACDVEALAHVLVGVGALACDLGDGLESVDVNPVLVRPEGAFALDALVVLRGAGGKG